MRYVCTNSRIPKPCRTRFSGVCFDPSCHDSADRALVALSVAPMVLFAASAVFFSRKRDPPSVEESTLLRDAKGEAVLTASSYEVRELHEEVGGLAEMTLLRVPVGRVGQTRLRTFAFAKQGNGINGQFSESSRLFTVTLPRPMGLVVAEDWENRRAVVESVTKSGLAEQRLSLARLGGIVETPMPGDVLRAFTCTVVVYKAAALAFGAQKPERTIVMYGADGQPWPRVADALRRGVRADGDVTLILERHTTVENAEQCKT